MVIIGAPGGVVIIGVPRGVVIIGVPRGVVIIHRGLYANSEVRLKPDFAVLEYPYTNQYSLRSKVATQ